MIVLFSFGVRIKLEAPPHSALSRPVRAREKHTLTMPLIGAPNVARLLALKLTVSIETLTDSVN
jgi:hypothetical protein